MTHNLRSPTLERIGVALGLATVMASCGWQASPEIEQAATGASGGHTTTIEPTSAHTYFGAEFGAEQDALRTAPLEPPVQAF